jgi:hypothetical protein
MTGEPEVDRYVKDPSLLLELWQEVTDRLDAGSDNNDSAAMEAQLREIAKAIEKLDKIGVPVPDPLRAEKTRLAAASSVSAEAVQVLNHLADELEGLLKGLKVRLGRASEGDTANKPHAKRPRSPKTSNARLRELIVEALRRHGGSCHKSDVLRYMEQKLAEKLLPADMEWRETTRDHAWQNNAAWERHQMTKDGVLKTGSSRGIWELSEGHT